MWGVLETTLAVTVAAVLASAGVIKLAGRDLARYRVAGALEVAVAASVIAGPPRLFGFVATSLFGIVFTGYAVMRADRPCRCFGERLSVASPAGRIARGVAVLVLGVSGSLVWLLGPGGGGAGSWRISATVVGLVTGSIVVALPAAYSKGGATAELRASAL